MQEECTDVRRLPVEGAARLAPRPKGPPADAGTRRRRRPSVAGIRPMRPGPRSIVDEIEEGVTHPLVGLGK